MSEYISKEDALSAMCRRCAVNCPPNRCAEYRSLAEDIAAVAPADVEPVVRCEDCKYNSGAWRNGVWCVAHRKNMRRNDYCSRGVKTAAQI